MLLLDHRSSENIFMQAGQVRNRKLIYDGIQKCYALRCIIVLYIIESGYSCFQMPQWPDGDWGELQSKWVNTFQE